MNDFLFYITFLYFVHLSKFWMSEFFLLEKFFVINFQGLHFSSKNDIICLARFFEKSTLVIFWRLLKIHRPSSICPFFECRQIFDRWKEKMTHRAKPWNANIEEKMLVFFTQIVNSRLVSLIKILRAIHSFWAPFFLRFFSQK